MRIFPTKTNIVLPDAFNAARERKNKHSNLARASGSVMQCLPPTIDESTACCHISSMQKDTLKTLNIDKHSLT